MKATLAPQNVVTFLTEMFHIIHGYSSQEVDDMERRWGWGGGGGGTYMYICLDIYIYTSIQINTTGNCELPFINDYTHFREVWVMKCKD